jgi:GNAT superfamily N-acetyltransferase
MEWRWNGYELTDDRGRLDFAAVSALLAESYWACDRPVEVHRTAFANSVCFSLFHHGRQVGFARAVTDFATFTWIADVIIEPAHRGQGLGKWMMDCLLAHPALKTRSQWLATKDAHGLYKRFGFARFEAMRKGPPPP